MKIDVTWQVYDGYCGGSRPQHTKIDTSDYMDDVEWIEQSEEERQKYIEEAVQEDFNQKVCFNIDSVDVH